MRKELLYLSAGKKVEADQGDGSEFRKKQTHLFSLKKKQTKPGTKDDTDI